MIRSYALKFGVSLSAMVLGLSASACAEAPEETPTPNETLVQEAETGGAPAQAAVMPGQDVIDSAPENAWRTVDPENMLIISTSGGEVYVELAPEFAPNHVARMKQLAREDFYNYTVWHRVIDGFVAQGGGMIDNPNHGATHLPGVEAEFTRGRSMADGLEISELMMRARTPQGASAEARAGFWKGFQAGTQPIAQAAIRADGQVESWLLHCQGAASAARTNDPNSFRSQFYITTGDAEHLNTQYTVWGRVRAGYDYIDVIPEGTLGETMGYRPTIIEGIQVASDVPENERPVIEVMRTDGETFAAYLDAIKARRGGQLPDVCDIQVPVRVTKILGIDRVADRLGHFLAFAIDNHAMRDDLFERCHAARRAAFQQ